MGYTKKIFKEGDILTPEDLNYIGEGIVEAIELANAGTTGEVVSVNLTSGTGEKSVKQVDRGGDKGNTFTFYRDNVCSNPNADEYEQETYKGAHFKNETINGKAGQLVNDAIGTHSSVFGGISRAIGERAQATGSTTVAVGSVSHTEGTSTVAFGANSHAEGSQTTTIGDATHAEGKSSIADQATAHAEGSYTYAKGVGSHAEGFGAFENIYKEDGKTVIAVKNACKKLNIGALGDYSHVEGAGTTAKGLHSHAEGADTQAIGNNSHAEGTNTIAEGEESHAEGAITHAIGIYSHTEGEKTFAVGKGSHAEGFGGISSQGARGEYSHTEGTGTYVEEQATAGHAEGCGSVVEGIYGHAEGFVTRAIGNYSHAEGSEVHAIGDGSHAEGEMSITRGNYSHAEGSFTTAIGHQSHAEGKYVYAVGLSCHAEGSGEEKVDETIFNSLSDLWTQWQMSSQSFSAAAGKASHIEGHCCLALGNYSHAEGEKSYAGGEGSHVEGQQCEAYGDYSHAGGKESWTYSNATAAHASGIGLEAYCEGQTVVGRYNRKGTKDSVFQIGVGTESNRQSIFSVVYVPANDSYANPIPTIVIRWNGYDYDLFKMLETIGKRLGDGNVNNFFDPASHVVSI